MCVISENLNLAKWCLKLALEKYPVVRWLDRDDAFQTACLGLTIAARTHDPAKGSLSYWARIVIAQQLLRAVETVNVVKVRRRVCKLAHNEERRQAALHTGFLKHDYDLAAPEETERDDSAVLDAMRRLSDRQRVVIRLTYWDGLTRAEIAERLGVTRQRVDQIHNEGLAELREALGVTWEPKPRGRRLSACAS